MPHPPSRGDGARRIRSDVPRHCDAPRRHDEPLAGQTDPRSRRRALVARWLMPEPGVLINNGAVTWRDGVIQETGPWRRVDLSGLDAEPLRVEGLVVAGLINAHTHPELNRLAGRLPRGRDFVRWLQALFACRADQTAESIRAAQNEAITQSLAHGVAGWGAIMSDPAMDAAAIDGLRHAGMRGSLFLEVTGLAPGVADERFGWLQNRLALAHRRLNASPDKYVARSKDVSTFNEPPPEAAPAPRPPEIALAASPHAPYSVSPDLFRRCFAAARSGATPVCLHLAETPEEEAFCTTGRGALADFVRDLGVMPPDWRPPGQRPIPYMAELGLGATPAMIVHANYASADDIRWLGRHGMSVVYCPPSHRFFDHDPYPLAAMVNAGVNLCLGTDSLASSDTLSPIEAAREALQRHPYLTPEAALAMITVHPARALGWAGWAGALKPGMAADMVTLAVPPGSDDAPLRGAMMASQTPKAIRPPDPGSPSR